MRIASQGLRNHFKHGATGTRLHNIWRDMLKRCESRNPKYGGRGIIVCPAWCDFVAFQTWALTNGYVDHLTIEREDVNGNYEPGNCKWIHQSLQARNRRTTRWIKIEGRRISLAEACELYRIDSGKARYRLAHGWSVEEAFGLESR